MIAVALGRKAVLRRLAIKRPFQTTKLKSTTALPDAMALTIVRSAL
jgi:hypothetical protein